MQQSNQPTNPSKLKSSFWAWKTAQTIDNQSYKPPRDEDIRSRRRMLWVRGFTILSMFAFFGSFGSSIFHTYSSALNQPSAQDVASQASQKEDQTLKIQEQGYSAVLKREPNNVVALEGVVDARLKMKNLKGAVEPLKKLVELNPNRPDYKEALAKVEKELSASKK